MASILRLTTCTVLLAGVSSLALAQDTAGLRGEMERARSVVELGAAAALPELTSRGLGTAPAPPLWGVQVAASYSKAQALASFARIRSSHPKLIGSTPAVLIDTPLGSRGPGALFRVRIPASSRLAALELCDKLHLEGGSCVVLPAWR